MHKVDLFNDLSEPSRNLLDKDGIVNYYGTLLTEPESEQYFDSLFKNIDWRNDESIIFGKHIVTKRKVAWYGDKPYQYTYSNTTKCALPWNQTLKKIKKTIEQRTGESFNSCLLNLYHNGSEGMAWHSDDEKDLQNNGAIASLSLGAERKFCFKHKKTKETVCLPLRTGSLLVMRGNTQSHWMHRLPTTKKVNKPRINLTFRTII